MINGKFFTGLPEKMMNRTTGPNRQRTNFFWPDEADTEPVTNNTNTPTKFNNERRPSTNASPMSIISNKNDNQVVPKEMFKKQLTSKIEFYDTVDDGMDSKKETTVRKPSSVRVDPKHNNVKAFSSKIEFYDFTDDQQPVEVDEKPRKEEIPKKKTLQFDTKSEKKNPIKKNDEKIINIDFRQRDKDLRKEISKSVENLNFSFHNKLNFNRSSTTANGPNLSNNYDGDESPIEEFHPQRKFEINEIISNSGRRQRMKPNSKTFDKKYDGNIKHNERLNNSNENNFTNKSYTQDKREKIIQVKLEDQKFQDDSGFTPKIQPTQHEQVYRIDAVGSPTHYDDHNRNGNDSDYNSSDFVQSPPRRRGGGGGGANMDNRGEEQRSFRSHRHLVSNISFGQDDKNLGNSRNSTPRNIRSRAVTRVTVGLPD